MALQITKNYMTKNGCYNTGNRRDPIGIQVHSIGAGQWDYNVIADSWNSPSVSTGVTYVVDAQKEDRCFQLMPENYRCAMDGDGSPAFGNNNLIGFEMMESNAMKYKWPTAEYTVTDQKQFKRDITTAYNTAVLLCADICKRRNWNPKTQFSNGLYLVSSHDEGRLAGQSSGHSDPTHVWQPLGFTMDGFRDDIVKAMGGTDEKAKIYDQKWKDWAHYVLATVESGCNWQAIQLNTRVGIGILQWSYSRSYQLLRRFYDDDSSGFNVNPMADHVANNTPHSSRQFVGYSADEANNIVEILGRDNSPDIQDGLWEDDVNDHINNYLKPNAFDNVKASIYAETCLWWSGQGQRFNSLMNEIGGGQGTNLSQIHSAAKSNAFYSQNKGRLDEIYKLLNDWNLKDNPPDYGRSNGVFIPDDSDSGGGGSQTIVSPPAEEEPPVVEEPNVETFTIDKMIKSGNIYHVFGRDTNGSTVSLQLYKEGVNIFRPNSDTIENGGGGVAVNPPTPDNPNPSPAPNPIPPAGGSASAQEFVDLARSYVGKIRYANDGGEARFTLDDGVADCSSFVISVYYMYTGNKLYANNVICNYTGNVKDAGQLVANGTGGGDQIIQWLNDGKLETGDILTCELLPGIAGDDAHVGIYGGGDSWIHCSGSGVTDVSFRSYWGGRNGRPYVTANRLFDKTLELDQNT